MKGLLAGFASESELNGALARFAGWHEVETYTPIPLESGGTRSAIPVWMMGAGFSGFAGFFLLMTYADTRAYVLDIGGRPHFAWPTFIPIAFEIGVLCAMTVGFVAFFIASRLPRLYDPIDECASLKEASREGWFLALRLSEPERLREARELLAALQPRSLEEFGA